MHPLCVNARARAASDSHFILPVMRVGRRGRAYNTAIIMNFTGNDTSFTIDKIDDVTESFREIVVEKSGGF